jgi:O-antigen ligase
MVVGAGVLTLGCGRLGLLLSQGIRTVDNTGMPLATPELRLITPVVVLLVGALMALAGPRLVAALPGSVIGRMATYVAGRPVFAGHPAPLGRGADDGGRSRWVLAGAVVLAATAGAAGGLTIGTGPTALILLALVLCVFAAVLMRPEIVLVAVAAFPWLDWVARRVLGGAGPLWDEALLILAICLLLWCVLVLRRWELWTVPIALPLVPAFAVAVGSVVVNDVPGDVGLYALRTLFEPLLFYFLGFLFPKDKSWVRAAIAVFVLAGTVLALHGIYQYAIGAPMPASWVDVRETDISTRAYSIIQNPNGLGAFLLMGALISMSLALTRRSRPVSRVLWGGACAVHLGGIAVTFSRGAWIALAAGVLTLLVMAYRRYLMPIVALAVVGWFTAPRAFINRLTFAFSSAYITKSSSAGRLYVWKMALDYAGRHPWFGLGLGTFGGTSAVTFGYGRLWVDNFYLQLAAEGGLLLLALFLWVLLRTVKGLAKGYTLTQDTYFRALGAGAVAAFFAVAVANITTSAWETLTVGVGFWFLMGLATSATLHEGARPGDEPAATYSREETA